LNRFCCINNGCLLKYWRLNHMWYNTRKSRWRKEGIHLHQLDTHSYKSNRIHCRLSNHTHFCWLRISWFHAKKKKYTVMGRRRIRYRSLRRGVKLGCNAMWPQNGDSRVFFRNVGVLWNHTASSQRAVVLKVYYTG
jgi:hypothetical protein